ncbi:MAG: hypothetical protein HFJ53_03305 [Clostridia bacterium]|jgi:hypothetical protein|nr:hypothetical protein [Clostridia bacterium]
MEVDDFLKYMLNFFQNIDKQAQKISEELSQKDLERQDILHYIENTELNAAGYARVGKLLKRVSVERREIKKELEKINCLKDKLANKYNNKLIAGDIIKALKGLQTINNRKGNYVNRTEILKELTETV